MVQWKIYSGASQKFIMSRYTEILTAHGLHPVSILQETASTKVGLVDTVEGEPLVLKLCKQSCPYLGLEGKFLHLASTIKHQYLETPRLIASGPDYLLMSFVERENQTRDTILNRDWSDENIHTFCEGIKEFQRINLPSKTYTIKQHLMGIAYPVVKLLQVLPSCRKRGLISWKDMMKSCWLAIIYLLYRPLFRNVTTHYDLTTYNCAFTPSGLLSMLDFELGYALGDPFFDICYFLAIPPQAIQDWKFQSKALAMFKKNNSQWGQRHRVRFILLVCSLVRMVHFENECHEQNNHKQSISILLDTNTYRKWWVSLGYIS